MMETEDKTKAIKNNLYTLSYIAQRLRSFGFSVKKLPIRYHRDDNRYWTLLIDKGEGNYSILMTCMKQSLKDKRGIFTLFSSRSKVLQIDTLSAEVINSQLNDLCEAIDEDRKKLSHD
jgi:hypothetical protein